MRRVTLAICAVLLIAVYFTSAHNIQPEAAPTPNLAYHAEEAPAVFIDDTTMNWSTWETISPDTIVHIVPVSTDPKKAISLDNTPRNAIIAFFEDPINGIQSADCSVTDPKKADDPHRIS